MHLIFTACARGDSNVSRYVGGLQQAKELGSTANTAGLIQFDKCRAIHGYLAGVVVLPFTSYEVIVPQPGSRLESGIVAQRWKRLMCAEELLCCSRQVGDLVFGICSHVDKCVCSFDIGPHRMRQT